jgi:hypothetical protein
MWMTKIRQDALDCASDRQDLKNSSSTYRNNDNRHSYSPSIDIKFATRENGGDEGNERDRSSTDDKFRVTGMRGSNNGDCDNLFIYEFSEEDCPSYDTDESFVEADRVIESSEDITELGTKRKRKFYTPTKLTLNKELPPDSEQCPAPGSTPPEFLTRKTDINNRSSIVLETTTDIFDGFNLKNRGSQYTSNDDTFNTIKSVDNMEQELSWNDSGKKSVDNNITENFQDQSRMEFADEVDNLIETATHPKYGPRFHDDEEIRADYFGEHSQTTGNNLDLSLEFEKEVTMATNDDRIIPEMFETKEHRRDREITIEQRLKKRHRDESTSEDFRYEKKDNAMSSIESMDVSKETLASDESPGIHGLTFRSIPDQVEVSPTSDVRNNLDANLDVPVGGDIHDGVKTFSSDASPGTAGLVLDSMIDKLDTSVMKNSSEADIHQNAVEALGVDEPSRILGGCNPDGVSEIRGPRDTSVAYICNDVPTLALDGSSDISRNEMMDEVEVSAMCSARDTSEAGMTVPSRADIRDDAKTPALNDISNVCLVGDVEVSAMRSAKCASDAERSMSPESNTYCDVMTPAFNGLHSTSCDRTAGEIEDTAKNTSDASMTVLFRAAKRDAVETLIVDGSSSISGNLTVGEVVASVTSGARYASDASMVVLPEADIRDDVVPTITIDGSSDTSGNHTDDRVYMAVPPAADICDDVLTLALDGSSDISRNEVMDEVEVSAMCSARDTSEAGMTVPSRADIRDDVETINQPSDISDNHLASEAAAAASSCGRCTSDASMTVLSRADERDDVETITVDGSSSTFGGGTAGEAKVLAVIISVDAFVRDDVESQVSDSSSGTAVLVLDSAVDEPEVSAMTGAIETSRLNLRQLIDKRE